MQSNLKPLGDITVLDLSRVLAGPYCTMMLGDLGAEVIKVERPGVGDETRQWGPPDAGGEAAYYLCMNRNKRSLTVNLKVPEGQEIIRQLAKQSDVVIENYKVGTLQKMGLGYKDLEKINPGLIYCSITGFGQNGPYKDKPGYDFMIQGMGGVMSFTGDPDGPPMKVGVAIVDITAGLFACSSIIAEKMLNRPGEEWLRELDNFQIPCGPINTLDKVFSDPQVLEREMVVEVPHPTAKTVKMVASPMKMSETTCEITRHPPLLGEHTEEILHEKFGYNPEKIEELRQNDII